MGFEHYAFWGTTATRETSRRSAEQDGADEWLTWLCLFSCRPIESSRTEEMLRTGGWWCIEAEQRQTGQRQDCPLSFCSLLLLLESHHIKLQQLAIADTVNQSAAQPRSKLIDNILKNIQCVYCTCLEECEQVHSQKQAVHYSKIEEKGKGPISGSLSH